MANFYVPIPDPLAARFDDWDGDHGGHSPALHRLIGRTVPRKSDRPIKAHPMRAKPAKVSVVLARCDNRRLDVEAHKAGQTRSGWVAALVRRRLSGESTFARSDEVALLAIQAEFRRIGMNVNQIAQALNTAVADGAVLDFEIAHLENFRAEICVHMRALRAAFAGNLAYWDGEL
jgi:hypothetical protein